MGVPHKQSLIRFPISITGFPEAIGYRDTSLSWFPAAGFRRPRLRPALCFVTRGDRDACCSQLVADIKRTVTQQLMCWNWYKWWAVTPGSSNSESLCGTVTHMLLLMEE